MYTCERCSVKTYYTNEYYSPMALRPTFLCDECFAWNRSQNEAKEMD